MSRFELIINGDRYVAESMQKISAHLPENLMCIRSFEEGTESYMLFDYSGFSTTLKVSRS